eukprot:Pgem_evm1s12916
MAQAETSLTNCYLSAGKGVCPRAMPNKCNSECLVTDCKAHQTQTGIKVGTSLLGATLPWLDTIINPNDVKSDDITDNVQASLGSVGGMAGELAKGGQCDDWLAKEEEALKEAKIALGLIVDPLVSVNANSDSKNNMDPLGLYGSNPVKKQDNNMDPIGLYGPGSKTEVGTGEI